MLITFTTVTSCDLHRFQSSNFMSQLYFSGFHFSGPLNSHCNFFVIIYWAFMEWPEIFEAKARLAIISSVLKIPHHERTIDNRQSLLYKFNTIASSYLQQTTFSNIIVIIGNTMTDDNFMFVSFTVPFY